MSEFVLLVLVMGVMSVIDIRAMNRNGLKKEMIVYLVFLGVAGLLGILSLSTPRTSSIIKFLLERFYVEW